MGNAAKKLPDHLRELETLPITMGLAQAAKVLNISTRTLQRWIEAGDVQAVRFKRTGSSRVTVTRAEVIRLLSENPAR